MSGTFGNQNAIGNSGGKSLQDRKLAADVRKLTLIKIKKVLKDEDSDFQRQLLLRLASSVLPRLKETEENGYSKQVITGMRIVYSGEGGPKAIEKEIIFDKSFDKQESVDI